MLDDIDPLQSPGDEGSSSAIRRVRLLLLIPAFVCVVQALGLAINGIGALIDPGQGLSGAIVEAAVLLLLAGGLLIIAGGLVRLRAWARGPLIATQLIALLTAVAYAGLSTAPGLVLAASSLAAIVVVVLGPVGAVMEGDSPFGGDDGPTSAS